LSKQNQIEFVLGIDSPGDTKSKRGDQTMPTSKKPKTTTKVWAIRNRDGDIELYAGRDAPHLDGAFATAPRGTRFLGQLRASEAKAAIGFDLHKIGEPVEVQIAITLERSTKRGPAAKS
jgi:hypothetical protein